MPTTSSHAPMTRLLSKLARKGMSGPEIQITPTKGGRIMSITIDTYRYEEIYPSFKAATDEKEKTARINAAFLNRLGDAGVVLTGNDPIAIADIGCGPCDTLVKYLTAVKFAAGFKIRATDYST